MDANFDMIVDGGAEMGVGQASDAVAPISASSLFNAAEAASDLGAVSNMLSMAGAKVAPASWESAGSQIPVTGKNSQGKESGKMTPMKQKGAEHRDAPTVASTDTTRKTWFEISLGDEGLEVAYSQLSGREIIDCLENDPIVEARIVAALRRIHSENIASATPKQAKKLRKSGHIHLGFMAEGISDSDLSMNIILKALQVPDAPVLQYFSDREVLKLMRELLQYDTDSVKSIYDGGPEGVVNVVKHSDSASNLWVKECVALNFEFYEQHLKPMSVSHFGNFLHSLKHGGEEVALAVLHRIYSGEDEE
jgi:hypothetical protein